MTLNGFGGAYPGGPRRHAEKEKAGEPPGFEIRGGESLEASAMAEALSRSRRHRTRRLVIGVLTSLLLASSVGAYVGMRSNQRAAEELAQEQMREGRTVLEQEASRLLNELWKMENLERAPRR